VTEEKTPGKPRRMLQSALKVVKGDSTTALVERFTSEMTLVAEGLAEDQARLHDDISRIENEHDRSRQKLTTDQESIMTELRETQTDIDDRLKDLTRRLDAVERALAAKAKKKEHKLSFVQQLTIPIALVCITLIILAILKVI